MIPESNFENMSFKPFTVNEHFTIKPEFTYLYIYLYIYIYIYI